MNIFPENILNNETEDIENTKELEDFREYAIDFKKGELILDELGRNVIVEGNEAIKVWIWKALQTVKYRYKAYDKFGNEFETVIGKGFSKAFVDAEMDRFAKECLLVNSYILDVNNVDTDLSNDTLKIKVQVKTIYDKEVEVIV
ncbi:DUF2634 domain-containing protein [Clostridium botulinum]|uniref:DUF2634 domain-containing protein n=1 Tax=Clostridium botulinum TaxID=1491 RepID=UPI001E5AEEA0|nr:DUF2634 domain-containing protein [Clostridium botulinum]MCD3223933.1 DUF2634 domain-containing protein [Clostridium botulinum C/D]MCD3296282.1 DUF2634 domain-containing protein [Clostridium botulinum C/D]